MMTTMIRRLALVLAGLGTLALPMTTQAQDAPVRIADVRVGFMGTVKLGYWTPISVEVASKTETIQGIIEIQVPDSDGLQTISAREALVSPGQRNIFQHDVKIGSYDSDIRVVLRDQNGDIRDTQRVDIDTNNSIRLLNVGERLHVFLGSPSGLFEAANKASNMDPELDEAVGLNILEDLPNQWFDYDGVTTLVIATGSSEDWDRLSTIQQSAIRTWVRQGGNLVVSVGKNRQAVADSFLSEMFPATLGEPQRVRQPASIESFAKTDKRFDVGAQGLEVLSLDDAQGQVLARQGDRPLIVRASHGLGSVTLIGFDTDEVPFTNWQGRQDFWVNLLGIATGVDTDGNANSNRLRFSGVSDLATLLSMHLENFPEVTVVPFGWVALLIFGYILLIGPIDYFFLKKVVGRLELTWITFPTWVIVISVAAYYAAHWLKGDSLRVNRVEIVDIDQSTQTLRGHSFFSVFSPRIDKYTLTVQPKTGSIGDWSETDAGTGQSNRTCSWLGIPEATFRGVYNQGSVGLFGRRSYMYTPGESSLLDVPIQVWSVKSFSSQWLAQSKRVFDAELAAGDLSLTGKLTNLLDEKLSDVLVAYKNQVYVIPNINPKETIDLAGSRSRTLADFLADKRIQQVNEYQIRQGVGLNMNDFDAVWRSLLFSDMTPESYRTHPSNYLKKLDLSNHLDLGKVIVFAKVDEPVGELWMNALPTKEQQQAPEIPGVVNSNSYLRVLLDPSEGNR